MAVKVGSIDSLAGMIIAPYNTPLPTAAFNSITNPAFAIAMVIYIALVIGDFFSDT